MWEYIKRTAGTFFAIVFFALIVGALMQLPKINNKFIESKDSDICLPAECIIYNTLNETEKEDSCRKSNNIKELTKEMDTTIQISLEVKEQVHLQH